MGRTTNGRARRNGIRSTLASLDLQSVVKAAKINLYAREVAQRRCEPLELVREAMKRDIFDLLAIRQRARDDDAGELRETKEVTKDGPAAVT